MKQHSSSYSILFVGLTSVVLDDVLDGRVRGDCIVRGFGVPRGVGWPFLTYFEVGVGGVVRINAVSHWPD